jgi:hypothetical protein
VGRLGITWGSHTNPICAPHRSFETTLRVVSHVLSRADGLESDRQTDATTPSGESPNHLLGWVWRFGCIVLALELVGFGAWSSNLYDRFSLTIDWAGNDQAWYLIAHGHLNPFVTAWSEHYISDHGAIIIWLLAPLYWLWPHGVTLLWAQDLAVVVGQFVAFKWICELVTPSPTPDSMQVDEGSRPSRGAVWIGSSGPAASALLGLVLLVLNPWVLNGLSFDLHTVTFGSCFAILTAYDLAHHRRRFWVWVPLIVASGDVAATYLVGIVISALLAGRAWRRDGLALGIAGITAFGVYQLLGWNGGDGLHAFIHVSGSGTPTSATGAKSGGIGALVKSMLFHPYRYLTEFGSHWLSILANLLPAGGIGVFCAWGIGVPLVVITENSLKPGVVFSDNTFQSIIVYLFVSVGTIMVISRITEWRRWAALALGVVVFGTALGWAIVWLPRIPGQWLRVSPTAAATMQEANALIPTSDQVAIEQGAIGAFAERAQVTVLGGSNTRLITHHVWFVVDPYQGIQTTSVNSSLGYLWEIADVLHARLVLHGGGVWVFEWTRPAARHVLSLPTSCSVVPGWALQTAIGTPNLTGPPIGWTMKSSGAAGYIVSQDVARLPLGSYDAAVRLRADGPTSVQVWDDATGSLVAQRQVPATNGTVQVHVPFTVSTSVAPPATAGSGFFRIVPVPPPSNDPLEVRVFSPGGTHAFVGPMRLGTSHQSGASTPPWYLGQC